MDEVLKARAKKIIESITKLSSLPYEKPPFLLHPWVIKNSYHIISGVLGSHKSWFAFWQAKKILEQNDDVIVLYIDLENPKIMVRIRYRILGEFDDSRMIYWGDWPKADIPPPTNILTKKGKDIETMVEYIQDIGKHPVVIFDTLDRFHSVDENSAQEMGYVGSYFKDLIRKGATVIVLQQGGKPTVEKEWMEKVFTFRGSTAVATPCDLLWEIRKSHKGTLDSGAICSVKWGKNRYMEPPTDSMTYLWFSPPDHEFFPIGGPLESDVKKFKHDREELNIHVKKAVQKCLGNLEAVYNYLNDTMDHAIGKGQLKKLLGMGIAGGLWMTDDEGRYWLV